MTARTGKEYLAGLRDDRQIWLGDRMVSVLDEPCFQGSLRGMADYFDWQHQFADECLVDDPEKPGEKMNASLIVPRCADDLARRHVALERLSRYSNGLLGRTPVSTAEQKSAIRRRKTRPSCYMPGGVA